MYGSVKDRPSSRVVSPYWSLSPAVCPAPLPHELTEQLLPEYRVVAGDVLPAGPDVLDRFERQMILVDFDAPNGPHRHRDDLTVDYHLLGADRQAG